jgi:hypothetical protein
MQYLIKHSYVSTLLVHLKSKFDLSVECSLTETKKTFFNGKYVASEKNSGVSFPNFEKF